jgi:hypothetical protein
MSFKHPKLYRDDGIKHLISRWFHASSELLQQSILSHQDTQTTIVSTGSSSANDMVKPLTILCASNCKTLVVVLNGRKLMKFFMD